MHQQLSYVVADGDVVTTATHADELVKSGHTNPIKKQCRQSDLPSEQSLSLWESSCSAYAANMFFMKMSLF